MVYEDIIYGYPYNLLTHVRHGSAIFTKFYEDTKEYIDKQFNGLSKEEIGDIITERLKGIAGKGEINKKACEYTIQKYRDGKTYEAIGKEAGKSGQSIRYMICRFTCKLGDQSWWEYLTETVDEHVKRMTVKRECPYPKDTIQYLLWDDARILHTIEKQTNITSIVGLLYHGSSEIRKLKGIGPHRIKRIAELLDKNGYSGKQFIAR